MSGAIRWISLGLICVVAGCVAERHSDPGAERPDGPFKNATAMDVTATEYRVAPPDKLAIRCAGISELKDMTTAIRPDGKIQLNLIGEVYVAGKTPAEIGALLTSAGTKYYTNATIEVEVAEFNSKFYTVFGTAVHFPGKKAFTGRDTVIAALAAAGFSENAWPQQVSISRPSKDGAHMTAIIDMKSMYMTGDTRQNYLLEEGDMIYVPDSPLHVFEAKARQVLSPVMGIAGAAQMAAPTPK